MRCFCFVGKSINNKSNGKPIRNNIPSKHQSYGISETIQSIKPIIFHSGKAKAPIIDSREKHEDEQHGRNQEKITSEIGEKDEEIEVSLLQFEKEKEEEKQQQNIAQAQSDSSISSLFSLSPNNKYQNQTSSDDELEVSTNHEFVQQESSESLFSISVNSRKQPEAGEKEVNSPMKIVGSNASEKPNFPLNPIERIISQQGVKTPLCVKLDSDDLVEQESSDSLFSISVNSIKQVDLGEKEVNSPLKIRDQAKKEKNIAALNPSAKANSAPNSIKIITQSSAHKLGKMIVTVVDQEDKERIKVDLGCVQGSVQEESSTSSLFSISINSRKQSETEEKEVNSPMKTRDFHEKEKKIVRSNPSAKIDPMLNPIHKLVRPNEGILGKLIMTDYEEEKENVDSEQDTSNALSSETPIFKQKSNLFSELEKENRMMASNHGMKINSVLDPIDNLAHWHTGKSRRFVSVDYEEENARINSELQKVVTFSNEDDPIHKSKVNGIAADTSLSSWLVESEGDSPKSVKNSPERMNLSRRFKDDEPSEDEAIVGTIGSFWSATMC